LTVPWPYLPIEIIPSVALSERYTDNFFQRKDHKTEEFRTTLSPSLDIGMTTGKSRSDLHYTLGAFYSSALGNNPHFQHFLTGNSKIALTERFSLLLGESLSQSDDPGIANPFGLDQQHVSLKRNDATVSLLYEGDRHSGSLRYTNSTIERSFTAADISGTTSTGSTSQPSSTFKTTLNSIGAGGKLLLGQRTTLEGNQTVTFGEVTTTGSATPATSGSSAGGSSTSSFTSYETTVGAERELPNETRAGVKGSWSRRDQEGSDSLDLFKGAITVARPIWPTLNASASLGFDVARGPINAAEPSGSFTLTYLGSALTANLTGAQSLRETFASSQNVGLTRSRELVAALTYKPTDRVSLSTSGAILQTKFLQPDVAASQGIVLGTTTGQSQSTFYRFDTSVNVLLTRVFSVSLSYAHWMREVDNKNGATSTSSTTSGTSVGNFASNSITLQLTARYE
jgi:hypothetical protein